MKASLSRSCLTRSLGGDKTWPSCDMSLLRRSSRANVVVMTESGVNLQEDGPSALESPAEVLEGVSGLLGRPTSVDFTSARTIYFGQQYHSLGKIAREIKITNSSGKLPGER